MEHFNCSHGKGTLMYGTIFSNVERHCYESLQPTPWKRNRDLWRYLIRRRETLFNGIISIHGNETMLYGTI